MIPEPASVSILSSFSPVCCSSDIVGWKIHLQNVRSWLTTYVFTCPWLNTYWERTDIGQNFVDNVSTQEICSRFETDQSQ